VTASSSPRPGAFVTDTATRFTVQTDAPGCSVRLYDEKGEITAEHQLARVQEGVFSLELEGVGHGTLYRFVLGERALPDPYARSLPHGVHGPAMVVGGGRDFRFPQVTRPLAEQVIYELHVGTFTEEGTYASAALRLEELVALGVTTIELMPIAAFDGARGWGYDGVAHYAPFAPYGTPEALVAFVDRAHELGLSVLLDVVYNHFGPSGNYLGAYELRVFADAPLRDRKCTLFSDGVSLRRAPARCDARDHRPLAEARPRRARGGGKKARSRASPDR
jgi:maltooligosyltrehalose trehalohydrolase